MTIVNKEIKINSFIDELKDIGIIEYFPKKKDPDNRHFKFGDYELFSITIRNHGEKHENTRDFGQINMKRNEMAKKIINYFKNDCSLRKPYFPEFSDRYPRKKEILDYLKFKIVEFIK